MLNAFGVPLKCVRQKRMEITDGKIPDAGEMKHPTATDV
jgi:hypothetical protein